MGIRWVAPSLVAALAGVLLLAPSPPKAAATDLDCNDFSNQATAQEYLRSGDPYLLDGDGDGIACEGLPCPCARKAHDVGPTKQKSLPPYRLGIADARRATRKVAREFAQSDGRVTAVFVGQCQRRAMRHVNCLAVDRGNSSTTKTVCHLRVVVLAGSRYPLAEVASSSCRTASRLKLTVASALVAISEEMNELAGAPVQISGIERVSRITLAALIEWTRPSPAVGTEKCSAIAEATLFPNGILVSIATFDCLSPRAS